MCTCDICRTPEEHKRVSKLAFIQRMFELQAEDAKRMAAPLPEVSKKKTGHALCPCVGIYVDLVLKGNKWNCPHCGTTHIVEGKLL